MRSVTKTETSGTEGFPPATDRLRGEVTTLPGGHHGTQPCSAARRNRAESMPVTPLPGYRAELIHARPSSERPSRIAVTQSCPHANLAAGLKTVVGRAGQGQDQTPGAERTERRAAISHYVPIPHLEAWLMASSGTFRRRIYPQGLPGPSLAVLWGHVEVFPRHQTPWRCRRSTGGAMPGTGCADCCVGSALSLSRSRIFSHKLLCTGDIIRIEKNT